MNCGHVCGLCNAKIVTTGATTEGTGEDATLQLTVPQTTVNQNKRFCLVVANNKPTDAGTNPVMIRIGDNDPIPVYTKTGNVLRADQIRTRRAYKMIYGTDPGHFILENYIPESSGGNK